jgi:putative tricarboxylic transport membrane protein
MFSIKSQQDLGAAVLFILIGVAGLWYGADYEVGTASSMGPGYLPLVLSWGLIGFGIIVGLLAMTRPGPTMEPVAWRAVILTLGAILAYAFLIQWAGLAPAVFAITLVSALASSESKWKEVIALGTCLAIFCVLVFIYGLHQSMPVFGAS